MTKLQECQKEAECSLCLFWSGLTVLTGFFPFFKRCWSRCLRLFQRPGWMGCASLSVLEPRRTGVVHHQDAPRTLLLARCLILQRFPSIPGTDPVGRSAAILLGLWQWEPPWEKAQDVLEDGGGVGEGFGVGATPAKPSLPPRGGWLWLEMPSEEMGARLGRGGRTMLAKAELERLDLSPNPVNLILIFCLNAAKSVYFPFLPLSLSLFLSFIYFFHKFPSFLSDFWR